MPRPVRARGVVHDKGPCRPRKAHNFRHFFLVDLSKVDKTALSAAISACEKVEEGAQGALPVILLVQRQLNAVTFRVAISACEKAEKGTQLSTIFIFLDLGKVDKTILIAAISACEKVERGA